MMGGTDVRQGVPLLCRAGPGAGTPIPKGTSRSRKRLVTPNKQILGRELAAWLGKLTLTGGDLDGQPFDRVALGTALYPGNLRAVGQRGPEHRAR